MFRKDSRIIIKNLKMRPSGSNGGCIMIVVDKFSKPPLLDGGGQYVENNKRVVANGVAIVEPHERASNNKNIVESLIRSNNIPWGSGDHLENGEKIHFGQRGEKQTSMAIIKTSLGWSEEIIIYMWKLMNNIIPSL